jgi:hypothetical protein
LININELREEVEPHLNVFRTGATRLRLTSYIRAPFISGGLYIEISGGLGEPLVEDNFLARDARCEDLSASSTSSQELMEVVV